MAHCDLDKLRRDWIVGISGEDLLTRVKGYHARLNNYPPELRARGVLITEQDPVQFAAAFFAAVSAEWPIVLANPNWGASEWRQLASLVGPAICFGERGAPAITGSAHEDQQPLKMGSILIPTGGSTGGVKLAIHTWGSLKSACHGVQDFLGGGVIDSCCVLPLYHVSGLMQLLRSFISGGRIRFDQDEVAGHCLSYVPTQLQRALASDARIQKLATARVIFVGGAPMSAALAESARRHRLPLVPVYGMTETAAMCAAVPLQDFLTNPAAGAVPLGNTQFSVEPDGRLCIHSSALFQGYQGEAPIDCAAGYRTDDEARLDPESRLHVLGRMDRILITGGEKVDPAEIEAALLQIEGVTAAKVLGEPDPEWGQRVVAQVVLSQPISDPAIKGALAESLSAHKVPKDIQRVDIIPQKAI